MKFSCEKLQLLLAILTASRAVATKSPVPLLDGLLLETEGENIRISGYDLKTGIVTTLPAEVEEAGGIVLNARLFGEIIRKMPGQYISVSVSHNYVAAISSENSDFEILGSPPSDFPELPTVDGQDSVEIEESLLKKMISQTNFAVSDNESRPIHTGALFEINGGGLTIVAVDGYRLALRRESMEESDNRSFSFVVPGAALSEVEKIAAEDTGKVAITLGSKYIMFTFGNTLLISRRLEGDFLNYRSAIPQSSKYQLRIDKNDFIGAVERVSLIINDKLKSPVRCVFGDGVAKISSVSALGKANDECSFEGDGDGLEIGLNDKYLLDALKAVPAEDINLELTTGIAPCVISPTGDEKNFLYMILPVRLKAYEG